MKYKEAAMIFKLPVQVLYALRAKKVLFSDVELTGEELTMLKGIAPLWGSEFFLRKQLSKMSKKRRQKLIQQADLSKPERFMFTRFMNAKRGEVTQELSIDQVASEAMTFLRIPVHEKTTLKMVKIAKKMRQKVYYEIRKQKKVQMNN